MVFANFASVEHGVKGRNLINTNLCHVQNLHRQQQATSASANPGRNQQWQMQCAA
jgi:hypothetical protein